MLSILQRTSNTVNTKYFKSVSKYNAHALVLYILQIYKILQRNTFQSFTCVTPCWNIAHSIQIVFFYNATPRHLVIIVIPHKPSNENQKMIDIDGGSNSCRRRKRWWKQWRSL